MTNSILRSRTSRPDTHKKSQECIYRIRSKTWPKFMPAWCQQLEDGTRGPIWSCIFAYLRVLLNKLCLQQYFPVPSRQNSGTGLQQGQPQTLRETANSSLMTRVWWAEGKWLLLSWRDYGNGDRSLAKISLRGRTRKMKCRPGYFYRSQ